MTEVVVHLDHIRKAFGSCVAIEDASLQVLRGEIHALCGENGAGKSTLMRVLMGLVSPDSGSVRVFGNEVSGWSTSRAIEAGVGMVHQHFMLVPTLTVAENIILGREPVRGLRVDLDRAQRDVVALAKETGLLVPAHRLVGELSVGIAQRVEILKVLHRGAKVLVLDEPTAVLSPPEVAELLTVLRKLKAGGTTIVLITHKLDEVMAISDRITVIRRGRDVETVATSSTTPREIAKKMVGREIAIFDGEAVDGAAFETAQRAATSIEHEKDQPLLEVRGLTVKGSLGTRAIEAIDFSIRPGEIFGVAGVEGNGQSELSAALAGLIPSSAGTIILGGRDVSALTVRERMEAGLAHIAEDRQRRGLILDYSIADNLILGRQHRFQKLGLIDRESIRAFAEDRIASFDIRPPNLDLPAVALSGGNQQKIVVARETGHGFKVLIAAQPTRGVDVGAIELIHARLREARDAGKAILLVSAELSEILTLSDRIGVLYRGRFAVVLPRSEASAEILGPHMTGAT